MTHVPVPTGPMSPAVEEAYLTLLQKASLKLDQELEQGDMNTRSMRYSLQSQESGPEHALRFTFYNPVVSMTVVDAISTLDRWSRRRPGEAIEVVFCSPGGSVTDGFALFDFLRDLSRRGHRITTTALGLAASMGAILMQAGDERQMSRNSFLLLHEISSGAAGSVADLTDHLAMLTRFQGKALDIFTERSSLTREDISARWRKADWYVDADEALELGLIDTII